MKDGLETRIILRRLWGRPTSAHNGNEALNILFILRITLRPMPPNLKIRHGTIRKGTLRPNKIKHFRSPRPIYKSLQPNNFFPLPIIRRRTRPISRPYLRPTTVLIHRLLVMNGRLLIKGLFALCPTSMEPQLGLYQCPFRVRPKVRQRTKRTKGDVMYLNFWHYVFRQYYAIFLRDQRSSTRIYQNGGLSKRPNGSNSRVPRLTLISNSMRRFRKLSPCGGNESPYDLYLRKLRTKLFVNCAPGLSSQWRTDERNRSI